MTPFYKNPAKLSPLEVVMVYSAYNLLCLLVLSAYNLLCMLVPSAYNLRKSLDPYHDR